MITAAEARRQVNQEMTEAAAKQMQRVEAGLAGALRDKQLSFTICETLVQPVKAKLLLLGYSVEQTEESERGMPYTVTIITF